MNVEEIGEAEVIAAIIDEVGSRRFHILGNILYVSKSDSEFERRALAAGFSPTAVRRYKLVRK